MIFLSLIRCLRTWLRPSTEDNHARRLTVSGNAWFCTSSTLLADTQRTPCVFITHASPHVVTTREMHYQLFALQYVPSQRSLHNAPIFRLLLKVAVNGTHQCDFLNFCGGSGLQYKCYQSTMYMCVSEVSRMTRCQMGGPTWP